MPNSQLYPFERNRYYPGKMLTTADFQAEQSYHIDKLRFMNSLMFGSGIVCGCGVFNLDDLSILIESGVVIDGTGREIIIDSSVVKKLSTVKGIGSRMLFFSILNYLLSKFLISTSYFRILIIRKY